MSNFFAIVSAINSFNLSNVAEQSGSWLCKDGVTVQEEKRKFTVVCSRSTKTLNLAISRCCFAEDGKEMYQNLYRMCRVIVLL